MTGIKAVPSSYLHPDEKLSIKESRSQHSLVPHCTIHGANPDLVGVEYLLPKEASSFAWHVIPSPLPLGHVVALERRSGVILEVHKTVHALTDPPGKITGI